MSKSDVEISVKKKHRGWKIVGIVLLSILGAIIVSSSIIAIISAVGSKALLTAVSKVEAIEYDAPIITPVLGDDGKAKLDDMGAYNFIDTDGLLDSRNFKVLQLSDIHIGAGAFSMRTDNWTIKTVEDIIRRVKPDLVVVTGDIAYPVMFQSGTMNNKKEAMIFADLMENLGVYWTLTFGNHDTEVYSYYNREDIGNLYASDKYKHCLFNNTPRKLKDGSSVYGVGNFAINIRDKEENIVHTMFMVDSNAYLPDDPFGIMWKYDKIHDDQIAWYEETANELGIVGNSDVASTMYFHIPLKEYFDTVDEWLKTDDSDTIRHMDGYMGDIHVGGTKVESRIYDALVSHGTTGTFCGHNHKDNASYLLDTDGIGKGNIGVKLTYGMSIDYLAYPGIYKLTEQRGGRVIEINSRSHLTMDENIDNTNYNVEDFDFDRQYGFITYHVPYWLDLYRDMKR